MASLYNPYNEEQRNANNTIGLQKLSEFFVSLYQNVCTEILTVTIEYRFGIAVEGYEGMVLPMTPQSPTTEKQHQCKKSQLLFFLQF